MSLLDELALLLSAAGLVVGALGTARTGHVRAGFPLMLELWTAAGLLRLAGQPRWSTIVTCAALILLRRLVGAGLAARATAPPTPPAHPRR